MGFRPHTTACDMRELHHFAQCAAWLRYFSGKKIRSLCSKPPSLEQNPGVAPGNWFNFSSDLSKVEEGYSAPPPGYANVQNAFCLSKEKTSSNERACQFFKTIIVFFMLPLSNICIAVLFQDQR